MEQGETEQTILMQHFRYGTPLPEAIKNAPDLNFGLQFYYNAFLTLHKARHVSMGTVSPITWFMYVDFCEKSDIIGEHRDDFIDTLTQVDEAYIKHVTAKKDP